CLFPRPVLVLIFFARIVHARVSTLFPYTTLFRSNVDDRIGEKGITVDPDKIIGIVLTEQLDSPSTISPPDEETAQMARHLIDFLKGEVKAGRLTNELGPLQSGIGTEIGRAHV